jgi:fumarylacetoacetase-like protein
MKLVRIGEPGKEQPALLEDGLLRDLRGLICDLGGDALLPETLAGLRAIDPRTLPLIAGSPRIGPIGSVGKVVCVGLNYRDHAVEANMPIPSEPILFLKPTSSIVGPNDDVEIPLGAEKTDWEVELGNGGDRLRQPVAESLMISLAVISVSGVTRVSSSFNTLRPSACAFRASRRRSVSVKRRRRRPMRSLSTRFSSWSLAARQMTELACSAS